MKKTGFLPARVIHLHPTNLCNLNCQHCYSSSSPTRKDELHIEHVFSVLKNLKLNGYEILSISGGEPLIYKKINEIIDFSHSINLQVNLITNGMLLNKILEVSSKINMFAVSIDGSSNNHDVMRNKIGAFSTLEKNIKKINELNIPFGLVFCVTNKNIEDLMYVYDFAVKYNAKLLQFHPLVSTGRGKGINTTSLSSKELERLYLTAKLLEQASLGSNLTIQVDLLPKNSLPQARSCQVTASQNEPISHNINPIVITETGDIMPFAYGIDKQFSLGNIKEPWKDIKNRYKNKKYYEIDKLIKKSFNQHEESNDKIQDWYYSLVELSQIKA